MQMISLSKLLLLNGGSCISIADIDECSNIQLNVCPQVCTNTIGGFICSCREGFQRESGNGTTCIGKTHAFVKWINISLVTLGSWLTMFAEEIYSFRLMQVSSIRILFPTMTREIVWLRLSPSQPRICITHTSVTSHRLWKCLIFVDDLYKKKRNKTTKNKKKRKQKKRPSYFSDIDECASGQALCDHICNNNEGSYSCRCYYGYQINTDGRGCTQGLSFGWMYMHVISKALRAVTKADLTPPQSRQDIQCPRSQNI